MTIEPFSEFHHWFEAARAASVKEPEAMAVATVGADGRPSVRILLLRGFDERGFVFFGNLESQKARELGANPVAALVLYWEPIGIQVRAEGRVDPLPTVEIDAYWAERPRLNQIGAWASEQSRPVASREELDRRVAHFTALYEGKPVPRPSGWGGFRMRPDRIEFWKRGEGRLHDREDWRLTDGGWKRTLLFP